MAKMAIEIDRATLDHYKRLAGAKYSNLYTAILSEVNAKGRNDLTAAVQKYSVLFSGALHLVNEKAKQEPSFEQIIHDNALLLLYSAYIASKMVCKDAETLVDQNSQNRSMLLETIVSSGKSLVPERSTDYAAVRSTLENLVNYADESGKQPIETILSYFSEYNAQIVNEFNTTVQKGMLDKIKDIKWIIGKYEVEGIKPVVMPQDAVKIANVHKKEKDQFYTPLTYLHIPENKVLERDRIIGDKNVITYLERMVRCLFMYNPSVGKNPMSEKKIFNNRALLQGLPGGGKGAVSFYIINYAEEFNERVKCNLMVTCFNIDSSYEDGKIQKLKSQLQQITSDNRIFLIYEDEIDGLLKEELPGHQKKSDLQVTQEFNKFLDGQYPNNGNYLLLANINNINNLSVANKSRFYPINWQGAVTKEQKSLLFKYKLENGLKNGYVFINDEEFDKLGNMACEGELTGRDITVICESVCANSFRWNNLGEVYALQNDYERQLKLIDQMYDKMGFQALEKEVLKFIENRGKAQLESIALGG